MTRFLLERCYRLILNREPDEGIAFWKGKIDSGKMSAADAVFQFITSSEFTSRKLSTRQILSVLYSVMLNREPDEAGKAFWAGLLQGGDPIAKVINGFCESKEFTEICARYGIKPGSVKVN